MYILLIHIFLIYCVLFRYIVNGLMMLATFFMFRVAMFPYVVNIFAQTLDVDFFTVGTMTQILSYQLLLFIYASSFYKRSGIKRNLN